MIKRFTCEYNMETTAIARSIEECSNPTIKHPLFIFKDGTIDNVGTEKYVALKDETFKSVGSSTTLINIKDEIPYHILKRMDIKTFIIQRPFRQELFMELYKYLTECHKATDVDYLDDESYMKILKANDINSVNLPATPRAIKTIIDKTYGSVVGKRIAVVGRGETVGKYLMPILSKMGATVSQYHSKSVFRINEFIDFDIIISCTGIPDTIQLKHLNDRNPDLLIIDVGVSRNKDGKVIGDVSPDVKEAIMGTVTAHINGVGLLTRLHLLKNHLEHIADKYNMEDFILLDLGW